jgi:hypothetical protein
MLLGALLPFFPTLWTYFHSKKYHLSQQKKKQHTGSNTLDIQQLQETFKVKVKAIAFFVHLGSRAILQSCHWCIFIHTINI